jgi:two-component system chemotaxis response regulator CheB
LSNPQKKIRVLVADDSAFMRRLLKDLIGKDKEIEVVAAARNGVEALQKIKLFKPDVATLDIEMPVMDGLEALEKIMEENPIPVVMLSAHTQRGSAATIRALEKGAVDFLTKPGGPVFLQVTQLGEELINKIKTAAGAAVGKFKLTGAPPERGPAHESTVAHPFSIVAIGTSTGGPKALFEVMSRLKKGLNAAILIVQHMPPGFTKSLAQRLDMSSQFLVKEAENGDEVKSGMAFVAPGGYHMEVRDVNEKITIHLHQEPPVNGHRPSVDVLMKSVARLSQPKVGVIMTGMGNDGARGIRELKDAGAVTIGESAETCVVYGMPKAACQLGAIDHEAPLYRIADLIELAFYQKIGRRQTWI